MAVSVFLDQIKNWILEAYHQQLGPDMTFIIWWLSFYFENIGNELKFGNLLVLFKFYLARPESGVESKSVLPGKNSISRV